MILGIDEVGRGPWAGPLVVGAVVLGDAKIEGLTDSKKISAKRRKELSGEIHKKAAGVGMGWVHASELDKLGMSQSLVVATKRAVEQINTSYHEIIIDGTINFLKDTTKGQYVTTMKEADLLIASVSAASIVAKVARDTFMEKQALLYPEYGFDAHVGYGTARHRHAINAHGITPLHRLSFAPLQKYRIVSHENTAGMHSFTTTKQIGDSAENVVAEYLQVNGHQILERNWKTKLCEIDIISYKDTAIYFTEVKYRKTKHQGGGIAAITDRKLQQMKFAAELYATKLTSPADMRLAAATVSDDYTLQEWLLLD